MPMRVIEARQAGGRLRYRVHLDTARVRDGGPDPETVVEYDFTGAPPPGRTPTQHRADCLREAKALASVERERRAAPVETPLPGEGDLF